MTDIAVYSDSTLSQALGEVREMFRLHKRVKVKVTAGKRSLNQNDISHVWYEQMALEDRQHDAREHRRYCKLHFGIGILRSEDSEFREFYDASLKALDYETKLKAMEYLPVTSMMNKAQMTKYLEDVQADYATRGVHLEFPEQTNA